jgi:hypothetical protein
VELLTINEDELYAVPAGFVTLIVPVVAEEGKVAVICVELSITKVAETPLKFTAVAAVKLVPVITTCAELFTQPEVGVKFVIVGGAGLKTVTV